MQQLPWYLAPSVVVSVPSTPSEEKNSHTKVGNTGQPTDRHIDRHIDTQVNIRSHIHMHPQTHLQTHACIGHLSTTVPNGLSRTSWIFCSRSALASMSTEALLRWSLRAFSLMAKRAAQSFSSCVMTCGACFSSSSLCVQQWEGGGFRQPQTKGRVSRTLCSNGCSALCSTLNSRSLLGSLGFLALFAWFLLWRHGPLLCVSE